MQKKRCTAVAVPVFLLFVPMLFASPVQQSAEFVAGQVVDVRSNQTFAPAATPGGSNPPDAPLASRVYSYEVSIRFGCEVYVVRYQTPFHYLPSAFTPGQRVELQLRKHEMYFDLPSNGDLRLPIIRRRHLVCDQNP